jgi:hypothetical protein
VYYLEKYAIPEGKSKEQVLWGISLFSASCLST